MNAIKRNILPLLALVAVFLAAFHDWRPFLSPARYYPPSI